MPGTRGNDILQGNGADELLKGSNGDDLLKGSNGNDTLNGGAGNDTLNGGEGNDRLSGSEGNDRLNAGEGDDFLAGGVGSDILSGGSGRDTFFFNAETAAGDRDVVFDFELGADRVRLDGVTVASFEGTALGLVVTLDNGADIVFRGLTADDYSDISILLT